MTHFKQSRNICQATNYLQLTKCISHSDQHYRSDAANGNNRVNSAISTCEII